MNYNTPIDLLLTRRGFIAVGGVAWIASRTRADDTKPTASGSTASDSSIDESTEAESPIVYAEPRTQRWRIGLKVDASAVTCNDVLATFPVPTDWPEQTVTVVSQEVAPVINRWAIRNLPGGARQVVLTIPQAMRGTEPEFMFELDVTRSQIIAPQSTADFVVPAKPGSEFKIYLGNSPYIDTTDGRIRQAAKAFQGDEYESDWARVEAIYDWVRETVQYVEGDIKSASQAMRDGKGDCEELTSLFVAVCRSNKIPARMVWIPDHCYPEFYLEDAAGKGYWFPCQAAGTRQFGSMQEYRPILQKGDRFKVPEKRQPVRYIAEFFKCLPQGKGTPNPVFVREAV